MNQDVSFGTIIKEHRRVLDLTQAELARRVGCATITIRKIEADTLRPSVQIAERLAMALAIPLEERAGFIRLARTLSLADQSPPPLPTAPVTLEEIGREDLSGRAIRGYELGERIGSGGFGAVYRAVQPLVEREVAIKIILPQYANHPDFIRRFEAEAQLVARLEHPHIVPLYDYWREPGVAYLVMRLLRGGSLEQALKQGPLSLDVALRLLEQIGLALHAAHRVGVVHRDIKPANVLLDEDHNAYLADFGIAKHLGNPNWEEQTQLGAIVGSPAYLSPEQIRAEPVRPQTDIYSLGVMLYELLTGHKPFRGPTPIAYLQQHLDTPLPPLTRHKADLPPTLDPVLQRATAKQQHDRYSDVLAMLADIRNALADVSLPPFPAETCDAPTLLAVQSLTNPYKGLRAFGEADAGDFFGRDTLIQQLLGRLAEAGDPAAGAGQELARFLAVVGPSGSGKSSVVRAGLVPALRRGGLPGSENWFIIELLPGSHPLEELEAALLRVAVNPPDSLLAQLQESERGLLRAARRVLPAEPEVELVLVIDQFEEVFTLTADEAARAHFLDSLVAAVLDPRSRVRVIITLRADFTDRPLQYVDFGELLRQRAEFVLPLTPDELEQAIVGPAQRAGLTLEPGLVAALSRQVGSQPGALPLLQYALTELFERREGRALTLAGYQASGGLLGALARRAEQLYSELDPAGQELTRQLFLRLITLGEGVEDTRRRVLRSEIAAIQPPSNSPQRGEDDNTSPPQGGIEGGLDSVINTFGKYRLLTFDHDPLTRGPTVEVAHEALLREWGRLREWLNQSRADVRLQRLLAIAANEWLAADRAEGFLLRGSRLDQFSGWATQTTVALTGDEQAYLEASLSARQARRAAEETRQRRELETAQKLAETEKARAETEQRRATEQGRAARRLRWLALGLALFLIAAIGAAWLALQQTSRAERETRSATARELAAAAVANLEVDPERSILLALQAITTTYTTDDGLVLPEALDSLHQALPASRVRLTLTGHTEPVYLGVFSPDRAYIATSDFGEVSKIWNAATGEELFTFTGGDAAFSLNAGDKRLVTVSHGPVTTITIWSLVDGQAVSTIPVQVSTEETGYLLTPDWTQLTVIDPDGTINVWDATTGAAQFKPLFKLLGHTDTLRDMAFSPDGTLWATAGNDETARIWEAGTGKLLFTLTGHPNGVEGVAFSPDGRYLATSGDGTARIWDTVTGEERINFTAGGYGDIAFSPDGLHVATIQDRIVKVWDLTRGLQEDLPPSPNIDVTNVIIEQSFWLRGHSGEILGVVFNSDGTRLISAGRDGTARVWDISPAGAKEWLTLTGHTGDWYINDVEFSPDGTRLATSSGDDTAKIWDALTGRELLTLAEHTNDVGEATFSPDGTRLVTASDDHTAKIWDALTGRELLTLVGHTDPVRDVVFSPDGTRLATGSGDNTAKIWDALTGQEILTLASHNDFVRSVAFSPDGTRLATGSGDNTAKIWDALTGREIFTLAGHADTINDVAFSPGGVRLATASFDGTVKLWQAASGQELFTLTRDQYPIMEVAFSPDGTRLAAASWGNRVIVWDISDTVEAGTIRGEELLTLPSEGSTVAFSPDGRLLVTGNNTDTTTRVYILPTDELLPLAQSRLTRTWTPEECRQYLHVEACPTWP